jgi:hypothetical protein
MQIKANVKLVAGASGVPMMVVARHLPLHQRQLLPHLQREEPERQLLHVIGIVLVVHAAAVTFQRGYLELSLQCVIPMLCSSPPLTTLMGPNSMERQQSPRVWEGGIGCPADVGNAGRSRVPATCPDFLA